MLSPKVHTRYNGAVIFVAIYQIKSMDTELAYAALVELNRVSAETPLVKAIGATWVGSTISGLYILVPDEADLLAHKHLNELFASWFEAGLPVRCGVAYGRFICVDDAEEKLNYVGKAINTAARLAYAAENLGCLIDIAYEDYVSGFDSAWITQLEKRVISGKEHDAGFSCRVVKGDTFKFYSEVEERGFTKHIPEKHQSGLIIAYDLPQFTAGDESQIDKRVRSLVDTFSKVRHNNPVLRDAEMHFCPGGDGGIVVLEKVREQAFEIGMELARAFLVEGEYKEKVVTIDARIGIHYGLVALYRDISGTMRPSGRTCFIADDLTSDSAGKKAGLVFSEALSEIISLGSSKTLQTNFDELRPLDAGPAAGLRRFARKTSSNPSFRHPLIEQLFGPTSSWQLQ